MPLRSVAVVRAKSPERPSAALDQTSAQMKAKQCRKLAELKTALLACGFKSVDDQAAVLGLCRSSAWKVLKSDHKHSGLSAASINRMLASLNLPLEVRNIIHAYVDEKLRGAYGHGATPLKRFRSKLQYQSIRLVDSENFRLE